MFGLCILICPKLSSKKLQAIKNIIIYIMVEYTLKLKSSLKKRINLDDLKIAYLKKIKT